MVWLIQAVFSFIAAAAFGVIFNAPRKMIIHCGYVGMFGWLLYFLFESNWTDTAQASFVGAFVVALLAHILAKRFRVPMIVFSVSGIIPLVPGGSAYNAMRNVVENNFNEAIFFATRAFMTSGAIAMGLVFAEVMMQLVFRFLRRKRIQEIVE
ncbi:threonine/serine exporter family protein [Paenisporosarcina cavernae]|uniref:Threonine/serine exporter n=1 Tax=Paenisporosarcina cavernae TaxID=2320858 RepID=A0A385YRP9_9BACL|nr:threonine/serine exporter family protein [Paenisporosarcina cavernae]AYC28677.1 threonine/serine exporter [Paenisporosarcina cavernae]